MFINLRNCYESNVMLLWAIWLYATIPIVNYDKKLNLYHNMFYRKYVYTTRQFF